jgi:hypothetical protein
MIEREPLEVGTRGRIYTTTELRECLGVEGYGHGTDVRVEVLSVDRSPEWGVHGESAVFVDVLGSYGELRVPAVVRDTLGLEVGDGVRVTVEVV